ncbi:DNA cytosine methyltransferase [Candidatus Palauibacter sp.]|uniref:DNA cytosine methyltransferase n=1 Tax=Candidatus Palauibacter sp. TaxID=3101350 RepID=UPI003B595F38
MRTLDIFCGAGGSSAGARAAGAEIVAGIDSCPVATGTYAANFPNAQVLTSRLEDVDLTAFRRDIGRVELLLASPECRNHTCARGAVPRDEASRATALLTVDYARAFRPRWLVLENVIHMRPWSRYKELKRLMRDLGYQLEEHVLDSSHFGVPQARRRLFLVGDLERSPNLSFGRRNGRLPARSVLDDRGEWKTSPLFSPRRAKATLARAGRAFEALGDLASFLVVYYGSDGSGGWQDLDRPLRTITTVDRFGLVEHDGKMWTLRMLQVPELRRAMGLGDDFKLPLGTRRDRIKLLGNGVCPPVMETVVRSLARGS